MIRQRETVADRTARVALREYADEFGVSAALTLLVDAATESPTSKTIRAYVRVDGLAAGLRLLVAALDVPAASSRSSRRRS